MNYGKASQQVSVTRSLDYGRRPAFVLELHDKLRDGEQSIGPVYISPALRQGGSLFELTESGISDGYPLSTPEGSIAV